MRNLFSVAVVMMACGCAQSPTPLSPLTAASSRILEGRVYPDGTTRLWVTTPQPGTVNLDLTSVDGSVSLGLSFGELVEGACGQRRIEARPGNAPQITDVVNEGTFCVDVSDVGSVPLSGVAFSINVHFE